MSETHLEVVHADAHLLLVTWVLVVVVLGYASASGSGVHGMVLVVLFLVILSRIVESELTLASHVSKVLVVVEGGTGHVHVLTFTCGICILDLVLLEAFHHVGWCGHAKLLALSACHVECTVLVHSKLSVLVLGA